MLKAVAEYTALTGLYEKSAHEDILSIMGGISQQKGDVHITFCKPITAEEVAECAGLVKNERFAALAAVIDSRIHQGYELHKTNYIAADLLSGNVKYESHYTTAQLEEFVEFVQHGGAYKGPSMAAIDKVMEILLKIYATPVVNKLEK